MYILVNIDCLIFRHLEHSTIIYEDPQHSPLLRLSWNKQDPNYLATFSLDAVEVSVYKGLYLSHNNNSFTDDCVLFKHENQLLSCSYVHSHFETFRVDIHSRNSSIKCTYRAASLFNVPIFAS